MAPRRASGMPFDNNSEIVRIMEIVKEPVLEWYLLADFSFFRRINGPMIYIWPLGRTNEHANNDNYIVISSDRGRLTCETETKLKVVEECWHLVIGLLWPEENEND